jgi:DNA-binding SARP family transcriptional activator
MDLEPTDCSDPDNMPSDTKEFANWADPEGLAFSGHPYGLLVSNGVGAVVAANPAAEQLIGTDRLSLQTPRLACDVLGCRSPDGPLANVCAHELAAERNGPLPEVRIDIPGEDGPKAAWVTVTRLARTQDLFLTELRPGMADDRRRRTTPHWTSGRRLRIVALGRMRVLGNEGPIEGRWLSNRSGRILKLLVAQRRRAVSSDEIAERLWRETTPASVKALRFSVHVLRTELEPDRKGRGQSSFVLAEHGGYALNSVSVAIDADEFEDHVEAGRAALRAGDANLARERLSAGIALYGGDFLADEPYADWALEERDRLHDLAAEALRTLTDLKRDTGDAQSVIDDLQRLAHLEPFDTAVHAELFRLLILDGRRSEAVRRYQTLRHRMLSTFGEDLDFTLSDLLNR